MPESPVGRAGIVVVQIGMTMPVMEPDLDARILRQWATLTDRGPFLSLRWGERIAFGNPESLALLGALAAWTQRVPLVTTVVVPQLHDPVLLAKSLATGDMLNGGRLTVGVGVGGRREGYRAVGADWIPAEIIDALAPHTGFAGTEDQLAEVLRSFAAVGTDEIHLIPTSSDPDQLHRAADVAADFTGGLTS